LQKQNTQLDQSLSFGAENISGSLCLYLIILYHYFLCSSPEFGKGFVIVLITVGFFDRISKTKMERNINSNKAPVTFDIGSLLFKSMKEAI